MKKVLFCLALALLLTGCSVTEGPEETTETSVPETTQPGLYLEESAVEQQTNGAVRRYDLPEQYDEIAAIGDKLLLVKQGDLLSLTQLNGEKCVIGNTAELPFSGEWRATQTGFVYHDVQRREIVLLDPQLQQMYAVPLPEYMLGDPVISTDGANIFYCTETDICALETERKISRPIKSHSCNDQRILGSYFDDALLACHIEEVGGVTKTVYLSALDGQTVAEDNSITELKTFEDNYFVVRQDGSAQQTVIGIREGTPQILQISSQVFSALEIGGVIGVDPVETGLALDFFDVATGMKNASVQLDGYKDMRSVYADRWNKCVWLLCTDVTTETQALLRWIPEASPVEDETVYTGSFYSAESPDEEGLDACADRVKKMNKSYGVTIRIWQDALSKTNGYTFAPEHQVNIIEKCLDEIEATLGQFPDGFLLRSSILRIRIFLVRSINNEVTSTFYWENGDPTIVLCAGTDVTGGLLKGIGYVIDSKILADESVYDDWAALNPEGFAYGQADTFAEEYLNTYFLGQESMNSAGEDRCRIFYQAMLPDNGAAFQSEAMQQKLLRVCQGIREAWSLKKKAETYPWEQYLTESIAYQG